MKTIRYIKPEETYSIRKEVLRKNIDLPYMLEGDFDDETFHLGAFANDKLVSIATFTRKNKYFWKGAHYQLRGMASLEDSRGQGYGKALIQKAEQLLKSKNISVIWCNARVESLGFYKSMGYSILGNEFDVKKIGKHYLMFKEI